MFVGKHILKNRLTISAKIAMKMGMKIRSGDHP
jgi:hypothetical protein